MRKRNNDFPNLWEEIESNIGQVNEISTLHDLHNDIWKEELLEPPFLFYYTKVLHPRERHIVDCRIRGLTNEETAKELKVTLKTVIRSIYNIRYVFRNKARPRVNKFWKVGLNNDFKGWKKGSWRS